jgi:hypothetical protein
MESIPVADDNAKDKQNLLIDSEDVSSDEDIENDETEYCDNGIEAVELGTYVLNSALNSSMLKSTLAGFDSHTGQVRSYHADRTKLTIEPLEDGEEDDGEVL